jgi:prophage antirepressor-like protein
MSKNNNYCKREIFIEVNNKKIHFAQRQNDNFIDITEMFLSAGKKFTNWKRLVNVKIKLKELFDDGIPEIQTNPCFHTFAHPKIGQLAAKWLNIEKEFEFFLNDTSIEYKITDNSKKECSKCHELKLLDEFSMNKNSADGRDRRCKMCYKIRYAENDNMKEAALNWYYNNKERANNNKKKWREENAEKNREYNINYCREYRKIKKEEKEQEKDDDKEIKEEEKEKQNYIKKTKEEEKIDTKIIKKTKEKEKEQEKIDTKIIKEENKLNIFENVIFKCELTNGKDLRVFGTYDYPWFVAKDIASMLEYKDTKKAVEDNVDLEDKMRFSNVKDFERGVSSPSLKLHPDTVLINESGLYSLILRSNLEKAKYFKRWITQEVIPSIRKYGEYTKQQYEDKIKQIEEEKDLLEKQVGRRKRRLIKKGRVVYILENKEFKNQFKIGSSSNFSPRLSTYNTGSPHDYKILYYKETEFNQIIELALMKIFHSYLYMESKEWIELPSYLPIQNKIEELVEILEDEVDINCSLNI